MLEIFNTIDIWTESKALLDSIVARNGQFPCGISYSWRSLLNRKPTTLLRRWETPNIAAYFAVRLTLRRIAVSAISNAGDA